MVLNPVKRAKYHKYFISITHGFYEVNAKLLMLKDFYTIYSLSPAAYYSLNSIAATT